MEEHSEMLNEIIVECLKCPVCCQTCLPPIWQCNNGHTICGHCRERIDKCGLCKTTICQVRNRVAEKLSWVVKLPCVFADNGCPMKVEQKLMEVHTKECPFIVRCQLKEHCPTNEKMAVPCAWIGNENGLYEHIIQKHTKHGVYGASITHYFPIRHNFDARLLVWNAQPFWSMIAYNFKEYTMQGAVFGFLSQEEASRYGFSYKFRPLDSLQEIEVKGDVVSMRGLNPDLRQFFLNASGPTAVICQGQTMMRGTLEKVLKEAYFTSVVTIFRK